MSVDPFAEMQEAKRPQVKFGKVGDWFKGTVVDNTREIENSLSAKHEMQTIYEFKAQGGLFHNIEDKVVAEQPTEVKKGEFFSYFAKGAVQAQLKNAKLGQVVGLRFAEQRKSTKTGFNDTKIIKVYLGDMDPEYQGETSQDLK